MSNSKTTPANNASRSVTPSPVARAADTAPSKEGPSRSVSPPPANSKPAASGGQWVQSVGGTSPPQFGASDASVRGLIEERRLYYESELLSCKGSRADHVRALTLALVTAPKASVVNLDEDEKIRAALQDIHGHYSKLSRAAPAQNFAGLFELYTTMQYPAVLQFTRDFGISKYLVSKTEVFELFRFASDGSQRLLPGQFFTFVFNMSRVAFSRPPHSVAVDRCLAHFYNFVLTDNYRSNLGFLGSGAANGYFASPSVSPVGSPVSSPKKSPLFTAASITPPFMTKPVGSPPLEIYKPAVRVGAGLAKKVGAEPRTSGKLLKPVAK